MQICIVLEILSERMHIFLYSIDHVIVFFMFQFPDFFFVIKTCLINAMSQSSSDEDYETLGKHYLAFINFLLHVLFIFHPFNKVLLKSCFILI